MITNQDVRSNIDFMNPYVKQVIETFAREQFFPTHGDQWPDTIPAITAKVTTFAQVLFDRLLVEKTKPVSTTKNGLRKVRGRSEYGCVVYSKPEELTPSSMNLMVNVFKNVLNLEITTQRGNVGKHGIKKSRERKGHDVIVSDILGLVPDLSRCQFHCAWMPGNKYLGSTKRKRERSLPNTRSQKSIPYELTLQNEKADITFISANDQRKLPAHLSVLKSHSENNEYFSKMFEGSFLEAQTKNVSLDCGIIALKSLLKFIYEGEVDLLIRSNLIALVELLKVSHQIENEELFNHSIDLIHDYLEENKPLENEIEELILLGFTYDKANFFEPSLKAAEEFATQNRLIDWSLINKTFLPKLLILTTEFRLPQIQKSICSALESHLSPSAAPVPLLPDEDEINS